MRKIFFYLLILTVSIWIGVKIHGNPGYVLISYGQWAIETTLWFAIIALIFTFFIFYLFFALVGKTLRIPSWFKKFKQKRANHLTQKALQLLTEGNFKPAEKKLVRAAKNVEKPFINYLLAAKAAQEQNAIERRDKYLKKAHQLNTESDVAIAITQAQLQLDSEQTQQALNTLKQLQQISPHHPYLLKLLKKIYLQSNDWINLKSLIPQLKKYKVCSLDEIKQLEEKTYLALMRAYMTSTQNKAVETLWNEMSKPLKHNPDILIAYTDYLMLQKQSEQAEELLRKALQKNWNTHLVLQYSKTESSKPGKQLATAEGWLKLHGPSANLLLCLGRLCLRNRLWGQARSYLESSLAMKPYPETFYDLAYTFEKLNEHDKATQCYRKGLQLSAYPS